MDTDPLKLLALLLLAPVHQPWVNSLRPVMSHLGAMSKEHGMLFMEALPEGGHECLSEVVEAALLVANVSDDTEATVVLSYATAITSISVSVVVRVKFILPLLDELEEAEALLQLEHAFYADQLNEFNEPPSGVSFDDVDPSIAMPLKD